MDGLQFIHVQTISKPGNWILVIQHFTQSEGATKM